ncbi:MAG: hypothetical protein NVSMB64_17580 [Candidatus Velthaea sp.]
MRKRETQERVTAAQFPFVCCTADGAYGSLVRYGRDIIENSKNDMPGNVGRAGMHRVNTMAEVRAL